MSTYRSITLPADPTARARRLAFERAQGGEVYATPAGPVLARETWPYPPRPAPQPVPDPLPADWSPA